MKKVGIITLYGLTNYGNRLQNYAVQKVLTDMGFSAKTYSTHQYFFGYGWKYKLKKLIHELTCYRFAGNKKGWMASKRNFAFETFTKKYLPTEKVTDTTLLASKADYFVIGSDQVWNPNWYEDVDWEMYLLAFTLQEQKVCFAPSFGISSLKEEWKPAFCKALSMFPNLSVREQAGADIIRDLTGQSAQVMIDPTLMLDAKDWLKIARKPYRVDTHKPYILTYFLGNRTSQVEKDISKLLKEKKRKVYHLLNKSQPEVYASGPSEFLYLFSKADIVLTDSFHA